MVSDSLVGMTFRFDHFNSYIATHAHSSLYNLIFPPFPFPPLISPIDLYLT